MNSTKKRIALATGRRIIAINLPVVVEAVCGIETQMRNTLTNMKQDGLQNATSIICYAIKPLAFLTLFLIFVLCGCGKPHVEEVRYTKYSNRYKNDLTVIVNTGKIYQGKAGILGGFDHCWYSFTMTVKSNLYTQTDMEITISPPGESEQSFQPKTGLVKIAEKDSGAIVINVSIDDARVPKLINGDYTLKIAEVTADHVWYRTK